MDKVFVLQHGSTIRGIYTSLEIVETALKSIGWTEEDIVEKHCLDAGNGLHYWEYKIDDKENPVFWLRITEHNLNQ